MHKTAQQRFDDTNMHTDYLAITRIVSIVRPTREEIVSSVE